MLVSFFCLLMSRRIIFCEVFSTPKLSDFSNGLPITNRRYSRVLPDGHQNLRYGSQMELLAVVERLVQRFFDRIQARRQLDRFVCVTAWKVQFLLVILH